MALLPWLAICSGWLGDRVSRKTPLMISILGYSLCNFIPGFSPAFWLLLFRALLGFFMGAEWPAGAALAMEIRSPAFMSGLLQDSWGIGYLLSATVYGVLLTAIDWRDCLWIGILPAVTVVYIRYFVKEPPVRTGRGLGRLLCRRRGHHLSERGVTVGVASARGSREGCTGFGFYQSGKTRGSPATCGTIGRSVTSARGPIKRERLPTRSPICIILCSSILEQTREILKKAVEKKPPDDPGAEVIGFGEPEPKT